MIRPFPPLHPSMSDARLLLPSSVKRPQQCSSGLYAARPFLTAFTDRQRDFSSSGVQRKKYSSRHCTIATWCPVRPEGNYTFLCRRNKFNNHNKFRHIVPRSELVGTGTPDDVYPLSESRVGPKIRGKLFVVVTTVAAVVLFNFMVLGHPFILLLDRYRRKAHYLIAKYWALATIAPFFKITVKGLENLPPPDTPAVYVSNHQSFLDIYALLTLGRSFKFISKTAIFLFPIVGWAMFLMGVIPLKRMDSKSQLECLKRCMDLLKKGASVFFFPEGTRTKDGKLGVFKKGAFSIAAKCGVPIVPITLIGTGEIMPSGKEDIINPGSIEIIIHKPIQGKNTEALSKETRDVIASGLIHHQG